MAAYRPTVIAFLRADIARVAISNFEVADIRIRFMCLNVHGKIV